MNVKIIIRLLITKAFAFVIRVHPWLNEVLNHVYLGKNDSER